MPGMDKTGPRGQGSKTGRGLGDCYEGENGTVGNLEYGRGGRFGANRGLRRRPRREVGRRVRYGNPDNAE